MKDDVVNPTLHGRQSAAFSPVRYKDALEEEIRVQWGIMQRHRRWARIAEASFTQRANDTEAAANAEMVLKALLYVRGVAQGRHE